MIALPPRDRPVPIGWTPPEVKGRMSQRRVKSRVANSGYSVSGSGRAIGYARWEVASLAQQFTTMVTTIIAIIVTAGGARPQDLPLVMASRPGAPERVCSGALLFCGHPAVSSGKN